MENSRRGFKKEKNKAEGRKKGPGYAFNSLWPMRCMSYSIHVNNEKAISVHYLPFELVYIMHVLSLLASGLARMGSFGFSIHFTVL